jgi:DNA-binding NtrC family response regulator
MSVPIVLVLDHEPTSALIVRTAFGAEIDVFTARNTAEAEACLRQQDVSVFICRDDLPGETGIMFLARFQSAPAWQRRVFLSPALDSELAVFLINEANIFRYLPLPEMPERLPTIVDQTLRESARIRDLFNAETENERLRRELAAPVPSARRAAEISLSWIRATPRLVFVATVTFAGVLAGGALTLFLLYLLKSLLGIDLIPGAHLSDALP